MPSGYMGLQQRLKGFLEGLDEMKRMREEAVENGDQDKVQEIDDAIRGSLNGIWKWIEGNLGLR